MKNTFRIISGIMLIVAILFLAVAFSHPELGTVFYIGGLKIGAVIWRAFYLLYLITMVGFFLASFFVKNRKNRRNENKN